MWRSRLSRSCPSPRIPTSSRRMTAFFSTIKGLVLNPLVLNPFGSSEGQPSEFALTRAAIGRLQSHLIISRAGLTYVMNIGFRSHNPQRAAQVANAVAEAYINDQLEAKYQATRRAGGWMRDRIKELRDQSTNAERAVVDFKMKNNIVAADGRLMNEQQLSELNTSLIQARAQTAAAKAKLDRTDEILRSDVEMLEPQSPTAWAMQSLPSCDRSISTLVERRRNIRRSTGPGTLRWPICA